MLYMYAKTSFFVVEKCHDSQTHCLIFFEDLQSRRSVLVLIGGHYYLGSPSYSCTRLAKPIEAKKHFAKVDTSAFQIQKVLFIKTGKSQICTVSDLASSSPST